MKQREAAIQEVEETQASPEVAKKDRKTSKEKKNNKGIGIADSQSHFTSQKGGGIKSRGTQAESNATLAQISEGEDLNSVASVITGSRKALNINV